MAWIATRCPFSDVGITPDIILRKQALMITQATIMVVSPLAPTWAHVDRIQFYIVFISFVYDLVVLLRVV